MIQIHRSCFSDSTQTTLNVALIGAGGNGSAVLLHLPYLHQALHAWGRFNRLSVTVYDGDVVSETNCVRQPFSYADVGLNKATVLVNRLNAFWGLNWKAIPRHVSKDDAQFLGEHDLVISCVDSGRARQLIYTLLSARQGRRKYWLDLGNSASSGQYVLGQVFHSTRATSKDKNPRLPNVVDLYPSIVEDVATDTLPSCSAQESLQRQEPFINQTLAMGALAMVTRLLRYGALSHHGAQYNAEVGSLVPIAVDDVAWKKEKARRARKARRTKQKQEVGSLVPIAVDDVAWKKEKARRARKARRTKQKQEAA